MDTLKEVCLSVWLNVCLSVYLVSCYTQIVS